MTHSGYNDRGWEEFLFYFLSEERKLKTLSKLSKISQLPGIKTGIGVWIF